MKPLALTGNNNEEKIWNYLKSRGLTDCGTAGLMGNLFAESGLDPQNLQNSCEKRLGMDDAQYTAAVDSGRYKNFVRDSAGYGIAQWTYSTRKELLLFFAKDRGVSIGDLELQLDFLCRELESSYRAVLAVLKEAKDVRTASDAVLTQFEKPADQSAKVKEKRAAFGREIYSRRAAGKGSGTMAVIIGSARIDERGKLSGGAAGDQKQSGSGDDYRGEVSMQNFYAHSKGWHILRAKNPGHAERIAERMRTACNNANLGYDQNQRLGVMANGIDTKVKTECDCSALVRACVKEATGKDPGNFNTSNEASALEATGLFEPRKSYAAGTVLYDGDILVTKTKGHTVVVVSGTPRTASRKTEIDYGEAMEPKKFENLKTTFLRSRPETDDTKVKYLELSDTLKRKCAEDADGLAKFREGETFDRVRSYTDGNGNKWFQTKSGYWLPAIYGGDKRVRAV